MQSDQIDKLAEGLAAAQKTMSLPKRNREVTVSTQGKGSYKFEYTTLDAIIEHVREPLTKNGLWFVQIIAHEDGKTFLDTTLVHTSGQWIRSRAQIVYNAGGRAQEFGSALTYMRRYALSALLGIASEDDDDANVADGNTITDKRDRGIDPRPPLDRPKQANGNGTHKDDKAAAMRWVQASEELIGRLSKIHDVRVWEDKNKDAIAKLKALDLDLYDRLMEAVQARHVTLSPLNA